MRNYCKGTARRRICLARKDCSKNGAELTEHLGYEKGDPAGRDRGNSRNGYSSKTVIGDDGAIEIAAARPQQHLRAADRA